MAVVVVSAPATYIGPTAEKSATLAGAAVGDFYIEEDTGIIYRKSVAGAWTRVVGPTVGMK